MPVTDMIVLLAVAAAAVLTLLHLLRLAGLMIAHRTIRVTIERIPEQAGAVLDRLGEPEARADDRTGLLLVAAGMAMVIGSIIINDAAWMHYAIAGALFPLLMGSALMLRHHLVTRRARAE